MPTFQPLNPTPPITMNPIESHTQPSSQLDDEPLRIRDYVKVSALVVGACASIAITFTVILACHAVDDTITRIFRRGGRHVPR